MTQGAGYYAVLRRGDDEIELGPDEIENPSLPDEHSVINEWQFRTPSTDDLEYYRHGELLLYFEDQDGNRELDYRGPVDSIKTSDQTGRTTIRGNDIFEFLEQEGPETGRVVADGIAWEEIKRVWGLVPGWTATVYEPEEEIIAEERVVQDGDLRDIFAEEIDETDPVSISGTEVQPTRIGWVEDALDIGTDIQGTVQDDDLTGGEGAEFLGGINENFSFQITLDHHTDNLTIGIRYDGRDVDENPGFEVNFDNQLVGARLTGTILNDLTWTTMSVSGTVAPGTYDVELVGDGDSEIDDFAIDLIAVYDSRYTGTDNEVHEPAGQLNEPQEYPDAVNIEADVVDIENAVVKAYLDVSSDTEAEQALGVRFHDDWLEQSNTESFVIDNPGDPTSSVQGRVTLGHTGAIRNDQTPRKGWDPQSLTSWELAVDETTLIVFEDQEFTGNWYQIMQEMHDEGGLIFRAIPDEDELLAETFERGALEDDIDWTRLEYDRGYEGMNRYANKVVVVGGEDDDGERTVVEVENELEIDRIGETIPDYVVSERHTTESELLNIATVELNRRIRADELSGTLEIVPRRLKPGYSYSVDAFDGESVVLERQTFSDGKQPSCQLEFEEIVDISTAVSGVRRETRTGRR